MINIVMAEIIIAGLSMLGTYKLIMFKIDDNRKEIEQTKQRLESLQDKHHGHNRELGELKQLLGTTHSLVTQIHSRLFHEDLK